MSSLRRYEVEVVFEVRQTLGFYVESETDAKILAVAEFRDWFAESYDAAPSASELDVFVEEVT